MTDAFNTRWDLAGSAGDPASELMLLMATQSDNAAVNLKSEIDTARKDAITRKQTEADAKKLQEQLDHLLAGIPADGQPQNLGEIKKYLADISNNASLTDTQRKSAADILKQMESTKPGQLLNTRLSATDYKKLTDLAAKYGVTPPQNNRDSILAWLTLNTGEKQGKKYIGSPTGTAASADDIAFLKDVKTTLNQRERIADPVDWASINPQIKTLLSAHFDSIKPVANVEDEAVRSVKLQMYLQNYNTAINGASSSSKSFHETKKSVTDRL